MRDSLGYPIPVSERISLIYLERCTLERDGHSLVAVDLKNKTIIPVAKTSVLMLGPGTSVTHAAASLAALEGFTTANRNKARFVCGQSFQKDFRNSLECDCGFQAKGRSSGVSGKNRDGLCF